MNYYNMCKVLESIRLADWYRKGEWFSQFIRGNERDIAEGIANVGRFRIQYVEADNETGEVQMQYGRWWYVEADFSEEALIKTAWLAVAVSDEHRRREGFLVNEFRTFDPHAPLRKPEPLTLEETREMMRRDEAGFND